MIKAFLLLLLVLVASVSATCPSLADADSFYCYTDGIQYEPDATCATAYYCDYDSTTNISKWAWGSNWGKASLGNAWGVVTGSPTIDQTSCPGITLVSMHKPSGSRQDGATAYDADLLMQIYITADRLPWNFSDVAGECDV